MNKATKCLECGGLATLYCFPHKLAGIWECQNPDCGASDIHEHGDYQTEHAASNHMGLDGPVETESEIYICGGCGVVITDTSPAEDRAEALAEA